MKKILYSPGAALLGTALLSGCAIYVPTIPATPLLKKGQVEVTAGLRGFASLEAGAAWSPAPHLLLLGESALLASTTTITTGGTAPAVGSTATYHDAHRQAGLGVGVYRAPTATSKWYLAAVGGLGFASRSLHSIDYEIASVYLPIPLPYYSGHYEARYRRYYGQLYLAQALSERLTEGFSLRSTWVDYTRLTLDGQTLRPTNRGFLEPTFFLRLGKGPIQGQGTFGFSFPTGGAKNDPLNKRTAPVSSLFGISVLVRPDLLVRRRE